MGVQLELPETTSKKELREGLAKAIDALVAAPGRKSLEARLVIEWMGKVFDRVR